MNKNKIDGQQNPASSCHRSLRSKDSGNTLIVKACPFRSTDHQRQRFLLQGDATQPITGIEIAHDVSSRYQISTINQLSIQTPFRLKILHFNDFHGRISHLGKTDKVPVFSRIVSRYRMQLQKYHDNPHAGVLLLSAGDDMVGTPFDVLMAAQHHPYDLYQHLGVDAAALGNHDLDLGIQTLGRIIQRSPGFPVLSANLHVPPPLQPWVYPAALVDVKGVRVGIIGLTTSAQRKSTEAKLLKFADPVTVVKNLLPVLRPYCHVLLVLSHLGYDLASSSATVEGYGDRQLAAHLPYGAVDAIIGGHTHNVLNETGLNARNIVNGIPIMQAGSMGRFLGELTITLQAEQHVTVTHAKLTQTADLPVDQSFEQQFIQPILTTLENKLTKPLGRVETHPDLSMDTVANDFASRELAIANFVTAAMLARVKKQGFQADAAMTDAAIMCTGLPSKTLSYADWFTFMPYADTLTLLQFTGEQLWQLLLDNGRRANRSREPHLERGFMQFSEQIRYKVIRGKHRQQTQITDVFVGDRPLQEQFTKTFTIVSHSFLRQLALPWEKLSETKDLTLMKLDNLPTKDTCLFLREELITYVQEQRGVLASGGVITDHRLQIVDEIP